MRSAAHQGFGTARGRSTCKTQHRRYRCYPGEQNVLSQKNLIMTPARVAVLTASGCGSCGSENGEGLLKVRLQIVRVFEADREAKQALGRPGTEPFH